MVILIVTALAAGLLTVFSPCILPVLPIALAAGATGTRTRSLGVGVGFIVSFTVSVALLATLIASTGLPAGGFRLLAIVVLVAMGVVLLLPPLRDRLEAVLGRGGQYLPKPGPAIGKRSFLGGLLAGLSAGALCTPCAGPILTAVATLAASSRVTAALLAVTLAYAAGIAVPLTALGIGARTVAHRLRPLAGVAPGIAGLLLIATAGAMLLGLDQRAQLWAAQATRWTATLQRVEEQPVIVAQLARLRGQRLTASDVPGLQNYGPADSFVALTSWLNSPGVSLASLRGRVVLIDFWTYSCVNCVRELPHLEAWYQRYGPDGFVVIGIHTPEFAFEHDPANVAAAVARQHVTFPVALDNQYATWNAYRNLYWPEIYLVDATGTVQYIHAGEGDYHATEAAIRTLLSEAGHPPAQPWTELPDRTPQAVGITPETYLGADHLHTLASPQGATVGVPVAFRLPPRLASGDVAFAGTWTLQPEYVENSGPGTIAVRFWADRVYVVLAPPSAGVNVSLRLDGAPIAASQAGADVQAGSVRPDAPRLYRVVDLRGQPGDHELELTFSEGGARAYSFTFG